MSFARRMTIMLLAVLTIAVTAQAQLFRRTTEDPRNPAPTVNGGSGLFTVYDADILRRGEFNVGLFANHFHRDPGDFGLQVYSGNFQFGLTDRIEVFASVEASKVATVGERQVLSGFYLPDVQSTGIRPTRRVLVQNPLTGAYSIQVLAFPATGQFDAAPSGNSVAIYPRLGAPVGGILPAIPPSINPGYYPGAPFMARHSGNGLGDIWVGGKVQVLPKESPLGIALIPLVKIPTTRDLNTGMERGRGTGSFSMGAIAAFDGRIYKFINLAANVGYIVNKSSGANRMNLGPVCVGCDVPEGYGRSVAALDLPDEWRSGIGVDFPINKYIQGLAEVTSTYYVGSRTPQYEKNSPVDFRGGVRIYPRRWLAIHGAYQRHLNRIDYDDQIFLPALDDGKTITSNGFIAGVSFGHLYPPEPTKLPNQPPVVTLEEGAVTAVATGVVRDSSTVCSNDSVALRANASDPDGDAITYNWSSSAGRVSGSGNTATFDATGLAPGDYTVTVQVDDGCGCTAFDTETITVSNCAPLTVCFNPNIDVSVDKPDADAGERVNFTTAGVASGTNYGNVRYEWSSTAGVITGSGTSATLDTTGVAFGTAIDVTVKAISDLGSCSASGTARTKIDDKDPTPMTTMLGQCVSFKRNNARVDNACKDFLRTQVITAAQADPSAKIVIDGYRGENEKPTDLDVMRARNTRDRLADGGLGASIDANRITVRQAGVTSDGSQVKVYIVPAGAADPTGGTTVDAGPVNSEKKGRRR